VFARSSTFHARAESIDAAIGYVRDDLMPRLLKIEGCIGLSMLVERPAGRCIATSAWRSEEAMRASEGQVRPLRTGIGEILGGDPVVDEWEIAVLHRDHASREGACVRATWVRVDPIRVDRTIDVYRMGSLPAFEELEGFCSASLMVNRTSGLIVSSVTYDSAETLERSREPHARVRAEGTKEAGAEVIDVYEFELALAHLHVPELA
jgi:hypothetical protein